MALYAYMQQTQRLLDDKGEKTFNPADIITYINTARTQIAGEAQAPRYLTTLSTAASTQSYSFSSAASVTGTSGIAVVRMISISAGATLTMRPWAWFQQYYLTSGSTGTPSAWAQLGQGESGTVYLYPTPTSVLTLSLDAVFYPSTLAQDTDTETLPYPFTDAIPYYAAYLALLSSSDKERRGEAPKMWEQYTEFVARARRASTPAVLPGNMTKGGLIQPAQIARNG